MIIPITSTVIPAKAIMVPLKPANLRNIAKPKPEIVNPTRSIPIKICENEDFMYPNSFFNQDISKSNE